MAFIHDLSGQRFGRWVVLHRVFGADRVTRWQCRCDCGRDGTVYANNLTRGLSHSCGCLKRELAGTHSITHGLTKTPEYQIWKDAKKRCYYKAYKQWADYGGRGITMCDRWRLDVKAFYADMGPRPSPKMTLERNDTNGPYSPENCRWATRMEQNNNQRRNHRLDRGEERYTMAEWGRRLGLTGSLILKRLKRGWSVERALTTPSMKNQFH